jgi:hypothetical protein
VRGLPPSRRSASRSGRGADNRCSLEQIVCSGNPSTMAPAGHPSNPGPDTVIWFLPPPGREDFSQAVTPMRYSCTRTRPIRSPPRSRLAGRDEARHVAFGVAHTTHVARTDPAFLGRLRGAVERRHAALADTAGLNRQVFDSLVLLAAGSWEPAVIERGWEAVQQLQRRMDEGRRRRLAFIGFPDDEAAELSALHTRNFM